MKKKLAILVLFVGLALAGFGIGNDLMLGYKEVSRAQQMIADGYADDAAWLLELANASIQRGWILTISGLVLAGAAAVFAKKST